MFFDLFPFAPYRLSYTHTHTESYNNETKTTTLISTVNRIVIRSKLNNIRNQNIFQTIYLLYLPIYYFF